MVANLKLVAPLIAREVGNDKKSRSDSFGIQDFKETALVKVLARFIDFRFMCIYIYILYVCISYYIFLYIYISKLYKSYVYHRYENILISK